MAKRKKKRRSALAVNLLLILIIAAAVIYCMPKMEKNVFYPINYSEYVEKYAAESGIDKYYIYAVIKTESGFDPQAESEVGARGLMQVMEDSYEWVKYRMGYENDGTDYDDMYDPETNIRYGTYLLKLLMDEYGRKDTAAAAYHTGRGNVNKWLRDSSCSRDGIVLDNMPSSATSHYVHKVMTAYDGYINLYEKE